MFEFYDVCTTNVLSKQLKSYVSNPVVDDCLGVRMLLYY